jgi:hypothetical protein
MRGLLSDSSRCETCGKSDLKVPTMTESFSSSSGQMRTPISQEAIRICPAAVCASPQACLDRFADVNKAQSIVLLLYRMYVLMCGAARCRPLSWIMVSLGKAAKVRTQKDDLKVKLANTVRRVICPVVKDWPKILQLLGLLRGLNLGMDRSAR